LGKIARWIKEKIDTYIYGLIEHKLNVKIESLLFSSSGDDSPPLPEDRVFIIEKEGTGRYCIIGVLVQSQGAEPGEKKLFSRDENGELKSLIYLKKDGIIELNGNADFAVRFSELESGFNQLKSDHNNFLLHVHSGVTTGPGVSGPATPPATQSTASVAGSKIEDIKVP